MSSSPPPLFRDVLEIARFQVLEAARTRRVLVLALLFVVGGILSAWISGYFLDKASQASGAGQSGAMIKWLQDSPVYRDIVTGAFGSSDAASVLATVPLMALVFAWLTMTFAPVLVLLTTSDSIGADIETRTLRYTLLRTGRLEYIAGRFMGHLGLLAVVIGLSAVAFLTVSALVVTQFPLLDTALAIARFWPWIVVDAMPYVALALAASMLVSSAQGGRALSLAAVLGLWFLHRTCASSAARSGEAVGMIFNAVDHVTPWSRGYGVLAPLGATFAHSTAICVGLTLAYLGGAFVYFRRRDV